MSDDAFALSPVAAQPPQPNEAVYQALNAALSATARGRWFLSEFAKRNRTSESSKMLDAVARIGQAVSDPALATAGADFVIVRDWAQEARGDARRLIEAPDADTTRSGAQRGMRIIREISSSLRAAGSDPRICDILDTQLRAIESDQRSHDFAAAGVAATFDRLIARIEELIPAPPMPAEPPVPLSPAETEARLAAVTDLAVACASGDPTVQPTAAQLEEDDNLLALIALEMGSPDENDQVPQPPPMSPPKDSPALAAPPALPTFAGVGSLGESVLAQGLVQPPPKPARDPFVALKRLTQSEKVALFT